MKKMVGRFSGGKEPGHISSTDFADGLIAKTQKAYSVLILALFVSAASSQAQTSTNLYWDPNGTTGGIGGSGSYSSTSATQWTTNTNGTGPMVGGGWTTANATSGTGNNAIYQGTVGTVSMNQTLSANQIQVNVSGYTIQNTNISSSYYLRSKTGILLGQGVNLNISSPVMTNGTATGFEGVITNSPGTSGAQITVTGATTTADSSVRVSLDGAGSVSGSNTVVFVPIRIATTGSGYASLRSLGGDVNLYGNVNVDSGSRLVLQGGTNSSGSRSIRVRGNLTTVNTDLVINESGDNGTVILYGTNSIGGNVVLANSKLGYASKEAFGNATLVVSNNTTLGQYSGIGATDSDRTIPNAISLKGDVTFGFGTYGNYLGGNLDLNGGTRTMNLTNSTYLFGVVSNGGINLVNPASSRTLYLNGNNTYAGGTTQNGGVISLGNNSALGVGSLTVMSNNLSTNVSVVTNAGVAVTNTNVSTILNTLTISADRSITNTINLSPGAAYTMDTGSNNWTQIGAISGSGSITKTGVGTLTLTGNNSYSNGTTVANGSLMVVRPNVTATITSNSVSLVFSNGTAIGNYPVLPGTL
ncbi:MAG: hypothetical protein EBS53_14715, partial [Bacteroidetes bacterium]|nr:hypothetical protein [Bacteroidota bacterium]